MRYVTADVRLDGVGSRFDAINERFEALNRTLIGGLFVLAAALVGSNAGSGGGGSALTAQ